MNCAVPDHPNECKRGTRWGPRFAGLGALNYAYPAMNRWAILCHAYGASASQSELLRQTHRLDDATVAGYKDARLSRSGVNRRARIPRCAIRSAFRMTKAAPRRPFWDRPLAAQSEQ